MSNAPLVSFLMPVYNGEKTVGRAIESMLRQTYTNIAIVIIIEYGCSDNTYFICKEYEKNDKRIRVFQNDENLGVAKSLNKGLALCEGKYIARFDADDVCMPNRIEKQVVYMEMHHNVGVLASQCIEVHELDNNKRIIITGWPMGNQRIKCKTLFGASFCHPSVMLRLDILRQNNLFYPIRLSEDYAFWSELMSYTDFDTLSEALVEYHFSDNNITNVKFSAVRKDCSLISKHTIQKYLGISVNHYVDSYFGWRKYDSIEHNSFDYLVNGAKLLREIENANNMLNKFDNAVLRTVLNEQWQATRHLAQMSAVALQYHETNETTLEAYLKDLINLPNHAKVIIYGTGQHTQKLFVEKNINHNFDILAFCDSNLRKQEKMFSEKKIISPAQLQEYSYDYVLISAPSFADEIYEELAKYNIPRNKIVNFLSYNDVMRIAKEGGIQGD